MATIATSDFLLLTDPHSRPCFLFAIACLQELDESLHHVAMNMESCSGRGSELFAKRKKRSDKWVVDESNLGASPIPPSAHADKFVQQQMMAQVGLSFLQSFPSHHAERYFGKF